MHEGRLMGSKNIGGLAGFGATPGPQYQDGGLDAEVPRQDSAVVRGLAYVDEQIRRADQLASALAERLAGVTRPQPTSATGETGRLAAGSPLAQGLVGQGERLGVVNARLQSLLESLDL